MPIKDKEKYNAYMKQYMLKRYHERMQEAINYLGGKCIVCQTEDNLNFHHTRDKEFTIAKLWNLSENKFWAEVDKCELRCEECHKKEHKTHYEHGTVNKYWQGCKCELCMKAHNVYSNEYRYNTGRRKRR